MTDHSPNLLALYDSVTGDTQATADVGCPPDPEYLIAARRERNKAWTAYREAIDSTVGATWYGNGSMDRIDASFRAQRAEKAYDAALARWWAEGGER